MAGQVFNERVTTLTQDKLIPSVVDSVNNGNVITLRVMSKPKAWSGESIKQAIQITNSSTGGSFNGTDTFDTTAQNNRVQLTWRPTGFYQSLVVPGIEYAVNQTEAQVIGLLQATMDEAKNSMANSLGTIFYGTGTGKDFDGLGNIVDDGTSTTTYGGLTRSTYTQVNANVVAASGGTITLDLISQEIDNVSAAGSVQESPNLIITTKAVFTFIESLLTPTVQHEIPYMAVTANTPVGGVVPATSLQGMQGFRALTYRGIPMVSDDKCTTGVMFFLNERYLEFHSLKHPKLSSISMVNQVTEGVYDEKPTPSAFQLKELQTPTNQLSEVGQIVALGNLIDRQPRRNGKITGITGV